MDRVGGTFDSYQALIEDARAYDDIVKTLEANGVPVATTN